MILTKPAGVAVQLMAAPLVIGGFCAVWAFPLWGGVALAAGLLLLRAGRTR